jgi:hypothetical protein
MTVPVDNCELSVCRQTKGGDCCSICRYPPTWDTKPMSLFQCCKCSCADDTALCHYWSARIHDTGPMCSACDPSIGKWHGEFARVPFRHQHKQEIEQWLGLSLGLPTEYHTKPANGSSEKQRGLDYSAPRLGNGSVGSLEHLLSQISGRPVPGPWWKISATP